MDSKEHIKNLALERIILFSDAVFAIAITLLVIELKLPELDDNTNQALANALLHTIPHFFSFFLSFFIIGIYWVSHHRMFSYVVNYNLKLVWLNLLLLLFIALMPFSSNVYGVYGGLDYAYYFYVCNISMVALFNFLLYRYIGDPQNNLSKGLENPRLVAYYKSRSWAVPACFITGVLLNIIVGGKMGLILSRMSPMLIWPAMAFLRRRYNDVSRQKN
jgi:uncharacterized membrane protein